MGTLLELQFDTTPSNLYTVHQEYASSASAERTPHSNFLRGVQWSPDGACLLTASDDNCLRVYDTPLDAFHLAGYGSPGDAAAPQEAALQPNGTGAAALQPAGQRVPAQPPAANGAGGQAQRGDSLQPALRIQETELVYDYCWYTAMSAADPASCCLATTCRCQPVHLWDVLTGELRCTYRSYNDLDEVATAHSLAFSLDGSTLYCGFSKGLIRSFRVDRPGRDCYTLTAYKKGQDGLPGIVSCMALNPDRGGMLAAGSFSGAALLLDTRSRGAVCLLEGGHAGGVTHLRFSADGNFLYTGARRDPSILCWDARYASGAVYSMQRASAGTNQRMWFDVEPCGRHLATGGEDGFVRAFDLRDGSLAGQFRAAHDTVNGVSFHPFLPLLATASGQRRYFLAPPDDTDADSSSSLTGGSSSSDDGAMGSGSSSSTSSSSSQPSDSPGAQQNRLTGEENVLHVWLCMSRPFEAGEVEMADVGDPAGEDSELASGGNAADAA